MFGRLAAEKLLWEQVTMFQVDERVVPVGDDARNLTHLVAALGSLPVNLQPMPVNDDDLEAAALRYGEGLPAELDLIHLGMGPDGHTASLVPGDPVLDVTDRPVALTTPYQGHRRMTLTYPTLQKGRTIVWLIAGADKQDALAKLLADDPSVPAGRVGGDDAIVLADAAAAGR
jgi:6-phosphogluconolactonase